MHIAYVVMIVLVTYTARRDATRWGVHPFRRLASDHELGQPDNPIPSGKDTA